MSLINFWTFSEAGLNARTESGDTALGFALKEDNMEIATALWDAGEYEP